MEKINSINDPRIILARKLSSSSSRKKHNKFLIEGEECLKWALDSLVNINYIICEEKLYSTYNHFNKFMPVFYTTHEILKKITDTDYLIPIIAVADIPNSIDNISEFVLVLDDIKNHENLGTIIRIAKAYGINDFLSSNYIDIYYKDTINISNGLVFSSNFIQYNNEDDLINFLRQKKFQIITTSPEGTNIISLSNLDNLPVALVIGNDIDSSSMYREKADLIIKFPVENEIYNNINDIGNNKSLYELRLKQLFNLIESKIKPTLGKKINTFIHLIKQFFEKELKKETDLDVNRVLFLIELQADKKNIYEQIMRQNGLLSSEIEWFLKPLVDKKLILRKDNMVFITPEGEDFLTRVWSIREVAEKKVVDSLTDSEKEYFNDILDKLLSKNKKIL